MQQNTSARTLRRAAVIAMIAGVLTVAAPVGVRALPGTSDDQPVLADTGASGYEPLILTVGVAMLAGGAVVVGAAKYRAYRVAGAEDEDEDFEEEFDEDFDEDPEDGEPEGEESGAEGRPETAAAPKTAADQRAPETTAPTPAEPTPAKPSATPEQPASERDEPASAAPPRTPSSGAPSGPPSGAPSGAGEPAG